MRIFAILAAGALLGAPLALSPAPAEAVAAVVPTSVQKSTHLYATKDGTKLYLDMVVDNQVKITGKRPLLIYSFGGGWETGARADALSDAFLRYFASRGYIVVSIDYRLTIKDAKARGQLNPGNIVPTYLHAAQSGAEDLLDATAFVLKHADEWGADKDRIVAVGSSAGATNSLVAEYHLANRTPLAAARLPEGFNFGGVIAMAGAFWLPEKTELAWKTKPAPMMFFHGAKDQLVTYDHVAGAPGYGPAYYQRTFPDYPSWFIDLPEGDHVMAVIPLIDYRHEIEAFLEKLVQERQQISIHSVERGAQPKNFQNLMTLYGKQMQAITSAPAK